MKKFFYDSPIGVLLICEEDGGLLSCELARGRRGRSQSGRILERAAKQLDEYFIGRRKFFDLPLAPVGTGFQRRVWSELSRIPYGEVRTYGEVARAIGNPKAYRAVGNANGRNPLPVIIPCHRVVAMDPKHGGFGMGMDKKRFLLGLEKGESNRRN